MKASVLAALAAPLLLLPASPLYPEEKGTDAKQLRAILTGQPPAELEKKAAGVLRHNFERIYGVKLAVNPEGVTLTKDVTNVVLVGRTAALQTRMTSKSELDKVKYDGYVVRVDGGRIAVAGFADRGTVYGAYGLLRELGYRFYAYGCERIPKPETSVIPDLRVSNKPFFGYRSGIRWELGESAYAIGDPRRGANPELFTSETGSTLWIDHTAGYFVPKLLYYDEHPEYYAMRWNGERIPKKTRDSYIHLCLSNPDVMKISADRAIKWMRLQPDRRFFCVTVGDGVDWCQCKNCKAMDVVPGNYSDRLLKWVNHVARAVKKEFPDNIVLTLAYCGTDPAPVKERPEKNVWVLYCPYWGVALSMVHPLTHPSNTEARQFVEGWLKVAPNNVGIYDYNMYHSLTWDAMAQKVKWFAKKGIRGIWHCGRPRCFGDLFSYIIDNLEWEPSLDIQELKEEFVNAYYGPAAPHVLQYLKLVENRLTKGFTKGIHEFYMPPDYYSYEFMVATTLLFENMRESAGDDKKLLGKIDREWHQILGDYRKAVTLKVKGLRPAERELALRLFSETLTARLEREQELTKALASKSLAEKRRTRYEKEHEQLLAGLRGAINHFAGISVPKTEDSIETAKAFMADPEPLIKNYPRKSLKTEPEKLPNGVRLAATVFEGGYGPRNYAWFCEPRMNMAAYSAKGPRPSSFHAEFELKKEPKGPATLKMEGQDADKDLPPKATIRITINDQKVFEGECRFVKRGWSWDSVPIEKGILRKGTNTILFENITPSARLDHYWFMVSEAQILFGK